MFKKLLLLLLITLTQLSSAADPDDFVITVQSNNAGTSPPSAFTIPIYGSLTYNYSVDCGDDGSIEITGRTTSYTCVFATEDNHIIRISDTSGTGNGFPGIYFNNGGDRLKLLTIEKWGTGIWADMRRAFYGASNLTISSTAGNPDFSNVTDMEGMFWEATLANPNTTDWDTSAVTDMRSMFNKAENAEPDTSKWDTHLVDDMSFMFRRAYLARPDVSSWDISHVMDMTNMFFAVTLPVAVYDNILAEFGHKSAQANVPFHGGNSKYCSVVAQEARDVLENDGNWMINDGGLCGSNDTANDLVISVKTDNTGSSSDQEFLINIGSTINYTYDFNVDCNNDGVNEVTNQSESYVCDYSPSGLNTGAGTYTIRIKDNTGIREGFPQIKIWGTSQSDSKKLIELKQWGTNKWKNLRNMFRNADNLVFTATDIPDFSSVVDFSWMFQQAASIANPQTRFWDVSSGENFSKMFYFAGAANTDVQYWDTSSALNMSTMFAHTSLSNPDVSNWDTSLVNNMRSMFLASSANPDVSNWNTGNVENMSRMFMQADLATPDTSTWNTQSVTDMSEMFKSADLAIPITDSWNITQVETMEYMFFNVSLPTVEYENILVNFASQNVKSNVSFHAGNSIYCSIAAKNARNILINTYNWDISDDGADPTCANQDPTITGLPSDITVIEDVASPLDFSMTTLSDTDAGSSDVTLVIQTHNANVATLTAISSAQITVSNTPTFTITLQGSVADINDYLNNPGAITFTGALNNNGNNADFITLTANDGGNTGTGGGTDIVVGSFNVDITAVNDDPTLSGLATDYTVTEDVFTNIDLTGVDLSDIDVGSNDLTLKFEVDVGTLKLTHGNVSVTGSSVFITDTIVEINTQLHTAGTLQYKGPLNASGNNAALLTITANDGGNTGTGGGVQITVDTANIDITAVNDDPTLSGMPTDITVTEDVASPVDLSMVSLTDIDAAPTDQLTLKLFITNPFGPGTLNATSSNQISATNDANGITLVGNLVDLSNYLDIFNNIHYTGSQDNNGNNADLINVSINDGGNTGIGGGTDIDLGSINVDITAVNDEPSISINTDVFAPADTLVHQVPSFAIVNYGAGNEQTQSGSYQLNILEDSDSIIDQITLAENGLLDITFNDSSGVALIQAIFQDDGGTALGGEDTSQPIQFKVYFREIIFDDGFEAPTISFKTAQASFEYDFSKIENLSLNQKPLLIAKGLNQTDEVVMKVYLRQIDGQLQIQMSNINSVGQWITNEWQNVDSNKLTAIYW